jgi:hypothetical protein
MLGYNWHRSTQAEWIMRHAPTRTLITAGGGGAWITLAVTACTVAIASCGSSSNPHTAGGGGGAAQGIKFADCMRSHGVPTFPDPSDTGGGIQLPQGSSPALEAAVRDCRALQPRGTGPSQATGQQKAMMLHLSQCMRAHGVTGFPDPVGSLPSSPAGLSLVFGLRGAVIAIPDMIDPQSPTFKQAAKACQFPGA